MWLLWSSGHTRRSSAGFQGTQTNRRRRYGSKRNGRRADATNEAMDELIDLVSPLYIFCRLPATRSCTTWKRANLVQFYHHKAQVVGRLVLCRDIVHQATRQLVCRQESQSTRVFSTRPRVRIVCMHFSSKHTHRLLFSLGNVRRNVLLQNLSMVFVSAFL